MRQGLGTRDRGPQGVSRHGGFHIPCHVGQAGWTRTASSLYPLAIPRSRRQSGYTLIEVIVAFAILALALTLLLGTLSGSARQVRDAADSARAALHAQSLLSQTGVGQVLVPGTRDGAFEDGRYRWTMEVVPYADPSRPAPVLIDPVAPRLLRLALRVEWGEGGPRQSMQLQTLRLAPSDGPNGTAP